MRAARKAALAWGVASVMLAGCDSAPTAADIAKAFGNHLASDFQDVSCAQAVGLPGYNCSYTYLRNKFTKRMVKKQDGGWDIID